MSNKVGIITIHSVYNYGAMLQAFSLSNYLNDKGFLVEVIDYRPYYLCRNYEFYLKDLFLDPRNALGVLKQSILKRPQFLLFHKFLKEEIPLSKKRYNSFSALSDHDYGTLITGSDQIWNPFITGWDESYLLAFDKVKTKKIAYSSSFGAADIPQEWSVKVKAALNSYSKLGVREQSGCQIVNELLPEKEVNLVLDPVFLLSSEYWKEFACDSLTPKQKYLLVYSLEVNDKIIKYAKNIAQEHDLIIVTIHPFKSKYNFSDISINKAGPKEFISLIDNAEFVVTNSFHGTAFSILLDKKFSCVLHSKTGTRMSSLMERIGLKSKACYLQKTDSTIPMYKMDAKSNELLKSHVKNSKNSLLLRKV